MKAEDRARLHAFTHPVVGPLLAQHLVVPQLPPGSDMERCAQWFVDGLVLGRSLMRQGPHVAAINTAFEGFFDESFVVAYGSEDTGHARGVRMLITSVGAQAVEYTGGHAEGFQKAGATVIKELLRDTVQTCGTIYVGTRKRRKSIVKFD